MPTHDYRHGRAPDETQGRRDRLAISEPITIGDDVWIGGNCTIVGGAAIGGIVVVAAGAVVARDVPDNCVVAGVPAGAVRIDVELSSTRQFD